MLNTRTHPRLYLTYVYRIFGDITRNIQMENRFLFKRGNRVYQLKRENINFGQLKFTKGLQSLRLAI